MNNLEEMINTTVLNFEPEDMAVVPKAEVYVMQRWGLGPLQQLCPASAACLVALCSMWESFPENRPTETNKINGWALFQAARLIFGGQHQPHLVFPFSRAVMSADLEYCYDDSLNSGHEWLKAIYDVIGMLEGAPQEVQNQAAQNTQIRHCGVQSLQLVLPFDDIMANEVTLKRCKHRFRKPLSGGIYGESYFYAGSPAARWMASRREK